MNSQTDVWAEPQNDHLLHFYPRRREEDTGWLAFGTAICGKASTVLMWELVSPPVRRKDPRCCPHCLSYASRP